MFVGEMIVGVAGLALGFVAGLLIYQKSRRWCGVCGATLRCFECLGVANSRHAERTP
jgi:hypothetical protein